MIDCPKCGGPSRVLQTRRRDVQMMTRRRSCQSCGERWTTREISEKEWKAIVAMRARMSKRGRKSGAASGDARRGFSIPPDRAEEYAELRRKTRMSARETARLLGIPVPD